MVIVDSSVWIDFLNRKQTPQTGWLRSAMAGGNIGLTTLVLTGVLQGIRFENRFRAAEQLFLTMSVFEIVSVSLAAHAARNYRALRARGVTVHSTVDCLVATFCIQNGHRLLHCDADYNFFEQHLGLKVVHP